MGPGGPPGYGPPGYPPPPGGFGAPPGPMGPSGFGPPPPPGYGGYGGFDPIGAAAKVKIPAIIMLVCTCIGMLLQIVSFFVNVLGTGAGIANGGARGGNNGDAVAQLMSGAIGIVGNVIGLLAGGFAIYGFLKMMKLQSRGLAYAAIIMSMIPCTGSCCYLNLWLGIWALIVMNDENVKGSFT